MVALSFFKFLESLYHCFNLHVFNFVNTAFTPKCKLKIKRGEGYDRYTDGDKAKKQLTPLKESFSVNVVEEILLDMHLQNAVIKIRENYCSI